jgi:hypothetical protein
MRNRPRTRTPPRARLTAPLATRVETPSRIFCTVTAGRLQNEAGEATNFFGGVVDSAVVRSS